MFSPSQTRSPKDLHLIHSHSCLSQPAILSLAFHRAKRARPAHASAYQHPPDHAETLKRCPPPPADRRQISHHCPKQRASASIHPRPVNPTTLNLSLSLSLLRLRATHPSLASVSANHPSARPLSANPETSQRKCARPLLQLLSASPRGPTSRPLTARLPPQEPTQLSDSRLLTGLCTTPSSRPALIPQPRASTALKHADPAHPPRSIVSPRFRNLTPVLITTIYLRAVGALSLVYHHHNPSPLH